MTQLNHSPDPPTPSRSYSSVAAPRSSSPPRDAPLVPTVPGLTKSVPAASFYSANNPVASTSSSTRATRSRQQRTLPKLVQPIPLPQEDANVEMDEDDVSDEDEVMRDPSPQSAVRHPISSSRSTLVGGMQPRGPIPAAKPAWATKPTFLCPTDEHIPKRTARPTGPGMLTPKVVAMGWTIVGGLPGIWSSPVTDYSIDAPRTDAGYPPEGTIPPSAERVESKVNEGMSEGGESETIVHSRAHRTATKAEVLAARPHPHAYYSLLTSTWAIFTPYRPSPLSTPTTYSGLDNDRPHMWRPAKEKVPAVTLQLRPLPPAFPLSLKYNTSALFGPLLDNLTELESSRGGKTMSVLVSGLSFLPTLIPPELWKDFNRGRAEPKPGEVADPFAMKEWMLIWKTLDSTMFKGEIRKLPLRTSLKEKLGWEPCAQEVFFRVLGYTEEDEQLVQPSLDESTEIGRMNRARFLRCWLEIGVYIATVRDERGPRPNEIPFRIHACNPTAKLVQALGGDNLERRSLQHCKPGVNDPAANAYHGLGVTPDLADSVISAAYDEQVFFFGSIQESAIFLDHLDAIAHARNSSALREICAMHRSSGAWSEADLMTAYRLIGADDLIRDPRTMTEDNVAQVCYLTSEKAKTVLEKKEIRDALGIIAKSRASDLLSAQADSLEINDVMDLDQARSLLGVSASTEDDSVIVAYQVACMDATPAGIPALQKALAVIAEATKSDTITKHMKTDPDFSNWEVTAASNDRPIGLTNIANTCYLNSLLQYFFTVRDLRQMILNFVSSADPVEGIDSMRVGGRLVTEKEVIRSKRFVALLQSLFSQLIHADTPAVTPETELAYLALVPSKEEEEVKKKKQKEEEDDDDEVVIISSSVRPAPRSSPPPPPPSTTPEGMSSSTVLGKRTSDQLETEIDPTLPEMNLPNQIARAPGRGRDGERSESEDWMMVTPSHATPTPIAPSAEEDFIEFADSTQTEALITKETLDGTVEIGISSDIEMSNAPPALPARPNGKGKEKELRFVMNGPVNDLETQVSSYMAFGKQNDVTECMDNVMFQIECALSSHANAKDDSPSIVKQLFYGKMRQRLEFEDHSEAVRIQDEPFSYLLVDVAQEGRHLYDGLDMVFDSSFVSIDGKQAQRRISLVDVPPILQVQLQRVQYDRLENKVFKSNAHMSFGDTISMDRYLEIDENDAEGMARREKTNACRKQMEGARARLSELTQVKYADASANIEGMLLHLSNNRELIDDLVDDELMTATRSEAEDLTSEIGALRIQVQTLREEIEIIWKDQKQAAFELVAVFMHRGTAQSGHYFIYQRDSKSPAKWLKYNDSLITDLNPEEEIFRASNNDSNPYFLVWVRKDRLDAIESVCRG